MIIRINLEIQAVGLRTAESVSKKKDWPDSELSEMCLSAAKRLPFSPFVLVSKSDSIRMNLWKSKLPTCGH